MNEQQEQQLKEHADLALRYLGELERSLDISDQRNAGAFLYHLRKQLEALGALLDHPHRTEKA